MVLVVPEQSQRPYRFGMTLLCVGALFNWLGLADTYSDPVPAIRYIGVGLIAAGASLICMAMCFWMRNIHDPNLSSEYDVSPDPIRVISADPSLEKPPDYSTVVDVPPCYEEAIKLSPAALASVHCYKQTPTTNVRTTVASAGASDVCVPYSKITTSTPAVTTTTITTISGGDRNDGGSVQSNPSTDNVGSATRISADIRQPEKCDENAYSSTSTSSSSSSPPTFVPNSSHQHENTLAKVLRKSIRGIRKLRNSGCDETAGGGHIVDQPSNMENGGNAIQEQQRAANTCATISTSKLER